MLKGYDGGYFEHQKLWSGGTATARQVFFGTLDDITWVYPGELLRIVLAYAVVALAAHALVVAKPGEGRLVWFGRFFRSLLIEWPCVSAVLYAGAVLMGAPLTYRQLETLSWAVTCGAMTASTAPDLLVPAAYSTYRSIDLLSIIGALSGAWCGAATIPLDWERPWQRYPKPIVFGSLFGHVIGCAAAVLVLYLQKKALHD